MYDDDEEQVKKIQIELLMYIKTCL